jgi:hypothetical protein
MKEVRLTVSDEMLLWESRATVSIAWQRSVTASVLTRRILQVIEEILYAHDGVRYPGISSPHPHLKVVASPKRAFAGELQLQRPLLGGAGHSDEGSRDDRKDDD